MGHDSLTCVKQPLHICRCSTIFFEFCLAIRTQIWLCRKNVNGHPKIIIWTFLADIESPILKTKIQPQSFLDSGEEGFYFFNHIWAWRSCSVLRNHLSKLSISLRQKAQQPWSFKKQQQHSIPLWQKTPYEGWRKLAQGFQKRSRSKVWTDYGRTDHGLQTMDGKW